MNSESETCPSCTVPYRPAAKFCHRCGEARYRQEFDKGENVMGHKNPIVHVQATPVEPSYDLVPYPGTPRHIVDELGNISITRHLSSALSDIAMEWVATNPQESFLEVEQHVTVGRWFCKRTARAQMRIFRR